MDCISIAPKVKFNHMRQTTPTLRKLASPSSHSDFTLMPEKILFFCTILPQFSSLHLCLQNALLPQKSESKPLLSSLPVTYCEL